jgi:hypothetical protein
MINTNDFRNAPTGEGPYAEIWRDKPHRIVYTLCTEIERLQAQVTELEADVQWWAEQDAGESL